MTKTKKDYQEWKGNILQLYSKKQSIIDAVWNDIMEYAEKEGYDEFMTEDEEDMVENISILLSNMKDEPII